MSNQLLLEKLLNNREGFSIDKMGISIALSVNACGDTNSIVALSVSGFGHNEEFNGATVQ